jgi:hypothetical protein
VSHVIVARSCGVLEVILVSHRSRPAQYRCGLALFVLVGNKAVYAEDEWYQ